MSADRALRRLSAILAADIVGYSRLVEADEKATLAAIRELREHVIDPLITEHRGRIVKLMGDGILSEFGSIVDAVACAVALQQGIAARQAQTLPERRIVFRIGINLGDVVVEGDDLMGDGVNVAARLEQLCEPGGILISGTAYDQMQGKLGLPIDSIGEQQVKNISRPVRVYRVRLNDLPSRFLRAKTISPKRGWILAAAAVLVILGGAIGGLYLHDAGLLLHSTHPQSLAAETPSIAVLPFANMSGDPELEYFADGVTETLTAGLSRSTAVRVIARTSAATYKGKAIDVRQIGRDLAAQYVLEGSVQKGSDKVRIVAQLIETRTGDHVWADRYDGEAADALALQDQVASKVIGSLGGAFGLIQKHEYEQAWGKDRASLDEYDYFSRGQQLFEKFTEKDTLQALAVWREGFDRNPQSGLLPIEVGWAHYQLYYGGWSKDPTADLKQAWNLMEQGLSAKSLPPIAKYAGHLLRAWLLFSYKKDWDQAWHERDTVLALNPNDASTIAVMAELAIQYGRPDDAIASLTRPGISWDTSVLWCSPYVRLGFAYFMKGEYQKALDYLQQEPTLDPMYTLTFLAATYAELGRMEDAKATVQKIREGNPAASLALVGSVWVFRQKADSDHLIGALRKAGLPE
jgi:TolB-like protein/class 3 adenylate cyclase